MGGEGAGGRVSGREFVGESVGESVCVGEGESECGRGRESECVGEEDRVSVWERE